MNNTFFLIYYDQKRHKYCQVNKDNTFLYLDEPVNTYLDKLCLSNGSSMRGRIDAYSYLTSFHQKPIILINEISQSLLFPLYGLNNKENVWICYNDIFDVKKVNDYQTKVIFISGYKTILDVNYRIINKQIERCKIYLDKLQSNKER